MYPYQILPLETVKNARDLGGYPCAGGVTRFGIFCRCAQMSECSEADAKFLTEYGIRSVLDLRSPEELLELPDAKSLAHLEHCHVDCTVYPLFSEKLPQILADNKSQAECYIDFFTMTESWRNCLHTIAKQLQRHRGHGLIFHCLEGKDRTGFLAILLLALVGCDHLAIAAHYESSATLLDYHRLKEIPDEMYRFYMTHPLTALTSLDYIETHYGSAERFLLTIGVDEMDIATIQDAFVEHI
ncbi:MAG: tyrosine-protein phosphatase [Eubacteriales bacterium]|nr:tyrosine-protein phosphatase [Eubacteriales bacterium]